MLEMKKDNLYMKMKTESKIFGKDRIRKNLFESFMSSPSEKE